MTVRFESTTQLPATPGEVYDALVAAPLQEIFNHRAGPIAPIREMREQVGEWGTVGAHRIVVQTDGSHNIETLVAADRQTGDYRYELTRFRGPFMLLVKSVDGQFALEPVAGGTRVTWSWELHPTTPLTSPLLRAIGPFWRRWAASMWPKLAARL